MNIVFKFIHFLRQKKTIIVLYLTTLLFSFLINFVIDVLVYDDEILSDIGFYLLTNIPVQVLITLSFLLIVIHFNNEKWETKIKTRLLLEALSILLITALLMFSLALFVSKYHNPIELINNFSSIFSKKYFYTTCIESLIILLFLEISYMLIQNQRRELKYEKIKYDNEKFKYNQLKSQINPHFLFNSLNVLNEMLYLDEPEKSSEYVCALSEFYRYVLTIQENDFVSLEEELRFINHFISILSIRYSNNLLLKIDIKCNDLNRNIIPMTIQILIENAVKHNIISKKHNLEINIESDGTYLIVSNNKNKRIDHVYSTGIGINNLNKTYQIFSKTDVQIIDNIDKFTVKIPLL